MVVGFLAVWYASPLTCSSRLHGSDWLHVDLMTVIGDALHLSLALRVAVVPALACTLVFNRESCSVSCKIC